MNQLLRQHLRYKLRSRESALRSSAAEHYVHELRRLMDFVEGEATFSTLLNGIRIERPIADFDPRHILSLISGSQTYSDHLSTAYQVVGDCLASNDRDYAWRLGGGLTQTRRSLAESVDEFHRLIVKPICDYLDEALDDSSLVLQLLIRYKQRSEWYRREDLMTIYEADTRRGEDNLLRDLCVYLHDQGLDFHLKPRSASGEIDLISGNGTSDPLPLDAKIFTKEDGKRSLIGGVTQVLAYTRDYNEATGYLLVFKICEEDVEIYPTEEGPMVVDVNDKSIVIVIVDIHPHAKTASKRGTRKTIRIDRAELIGSVLQT